MADGDCRPRNRRIAEDKYEHSSADVPHSPKKDLEDKDMTVGRVLSTGSSLH